MKTKSRGDRASKRITLVLPPRTVDRLGRLQELTDASSATEVIRNALLVYEVIADAAQSGGQLLQRKRNGEFQLLPISIDVEPVDPVPGEPQTEERLQVVSDPLAEHSIFRAATG